ncbi:sulfatase-like hydrolase/transferase [candidate division KSB1 bacterium]|nr:sulfatase-like hydrolase/transferase [candidate division KSB1 bacterium]
MPQTNILLITTDQQHCDTIGKSNPRIKTPVLDRLVDEGVTFNRAYCANPVCSPSRSTILTGLYPAWHHCWTIGVKLPEDVPTVTGLLHDNGYRTILIGKAHFQPLASQPGSESIECHPTLRDLDFWRKFHGPWYGFDYLETARMHADEHLVGQHYAIWLEQQGLPDWKSYFQPLPGDAPTEKRRFYFLRENRSWTLPDKFHHTHWVGERTIAAIESSVKQDQPFFLWSSFFDPHPPYIVPEPWASMYDPQDMQPGKYTASEFDDMPPHFRKTREEHPTWDDYREPGGQGLHGFHSHLYPEAELKKDLACYYGMMSFIDQEIGRILDCLDQQGIAGNTLVLFTTDHGHFLGQHGLIAKGAFHYEDMLRIPMIARFPGQIPQGCSCSALQSQIDFAPTFLSAAGVDVPGALQGIDQLDVWRARQEQARDHVICENRHNPTTVHLRTMVTERYKITVYREGDFGELFDLKTDPGELHNRWDDAAYAEIKSRLLHKFIQAEIEREPTRMPRIAGA